MGQSFESLVGMDTQKENMRSKSKGDLWKSNHSESHKGRGLPFDFRVTSVIRLEKGNPNLDTLNYSKLSHWLYPLKDP